MVLVSLVQSNLAFPGYQRFFFSRGSLFKTWPKPETAHENSLAPMVAWRKRQLKLPRFSGNLREVLIPECFGVFCCSGYFYVPCVAKVSTQPHTRFFVFSEVFRVVPGMLRGAPVFRILVYIPSVLQVRIHLHARFPWLFQIVQSCLRGVLGSRVPGISTSQVWRNLEFTRIPG